jgi:hypothetical protein
MFRPILVSLSIGCVLAACGTAPKTPEAAGRARPMSPAADSRAQKVERAPAAAALEASTTSAAAAASPDQPGARRQAPPGAAPAAEEPRAAKQEATGAATPDAAKQGATSEASPAGSGAPPPAAADARTAAAPVADDAGVLDAARYYVHAATEWLARGVDSFFGDRPFEQGGRAEGGIGVSTLWRRDEGLELNTRFSVRLDLPNLRRYGFVFFGRDNERDVITDRPEGFTRREQLLSETRDDQSFFAGLGTQIADLISLRAGVRGGLDPFVQARYRHIWELGPRSALEFKETVFWTLDDRFGSTTAMSFGLGFSPALALRWLGAATISQESDGFECSSSIGLYRSFGSQRMLSAESLINGETGGDVNVSEYGVRLRWEQPVYKDWLIGDLIIGPFWPRKNSVTERGNTWAVGAGLLMRF